MSSNIRKEKSLFLSLGFIFIAVITAFLYFTPPFFQKYLTFFENMFYDFQVRRDFRPVSKNTPVVIVAIDDASIQQMGRWPWPRDVLADLTSRLFSAGARVVAWDAVFSEAEKNIIDLVENRLADDPSFRTSLNELQTARSVFDNDALFAESLKKGTSALAFFFDANQASEGLLPSAIFSLSDSLQKDLQIPQEDHYTANIETLQKAAKHGGFINGSPDADGIYRQTPLLLRKGHEVYPSIGLEATRLFLGYTPDEIGLITQVYAGRQVLEAIQLGKRVIPTDPLGRILIPFRGPAYSLPYVSAKDLWTAQKNNPFKDKLVFIGFSAAALGDLVPTAVAPVFPGVEIHAAVANSILDGYLPNIPTWGKGLSVIFVVLSGLISLGIFPHLGPIGATVYTALVSFGLFFIGHWAWLYQQQVISFALPVFTIVVLYFLYVTMNLFFEKKRKHEWIAIFGQYLPPERLGVLIDQEAIPSLEGDTQELSILFADIRNFTTLSEALSAHDLKLLLNFFLTPMTKVIFDHKGTIDKYVGDLIMAFWGAPIENLNHPFDAVATALAMQKELHTLNETLKKEKKEEIHLAIGVNTGMVNVGDMGSEYRRAYTVLGDPVNLASRLETLCRYFDVKIIVGENTYKATEKAFLYRKLDRVRVKGKRQPVEIYEPLCHREDASSEQISQVALFEKALLAFSHQNWKEAEEGLHGLLNTDPGSKTLYEIYLSRIEGFKKTPPGAEWSPLQVFE